MNKQLLFGKLQYNFDLLFHFVCWKQSYLIILMMKPVNDSMRTEPNMQTIDYSPQKEEWAIINRYKALQFERMKSKERMLDHQKRQKFRRELDNQLNNRSNAELLEKQQDRDYYQQLSRKAEEMKMKEQRAKYEKFMKRKTVEQQNMHKLEVNKHSRSRDFDTGYHLDIGGNSERQHKEKTEHFKRDMMDTLDLQLKEKTEEVKKNKLKNQQMEELHKQMQENYFKPSEKKLYHQNQRIYDYYQTLEQQRASREKQLQIKLVDEAMERSIRAEQEKARQEEVKKMYQKEKVRGILDEQVKQLNRKRHEESQVNPEDISFNFISGLFRQKEQAYDKEKYKRDLQMQAEEQRQRKARQNHMSEEQYRLNMNQLSKAVSGSYAQQNYLDRSMGAIGDHKKFELDNLQQDMKDKDADIIKRRLQSLRNRGVISSVDEKHF